MEEAEGAQLRPRARNLLCSLELVRALLREQSLSQPGTYSEPVRAALMQFDRLFAEFELRWGLGVGAVGAQWGPVAPHCSPTPQLRVLAGGSEIP